MPRILRIINRFNLGGPTYNAAYLSKYLPADKYETLLVGGLKDEDEASSEFILQNLGVSYRILPQMRRKIDLLQDRKAYRDIVQLIREFKPDIVHTHAAKAGALGRWAAFSNKVPVTVHTFHGHVFHSYFGRIQSAFYKTIERSLARRTSAIVAISDKQKSELCQEHRIAPDSKVHVIPLGFDLDRFHNAGEAERSRFRAKYGITDEVIAIGIIGRLVPVKNHELFLRAIAFLKENSRQPFKAFIIGDGERRSSLEEMVRKASLEKEVIFTSWEKEVDKVYPGLDIVCLTSFNEGTPVSLIEAQAAGRPLISTRVGGVENVVLQNRTAFLTEVSDENGFCRNLLNLVENKELRQNFSKNGWNHVKNAFHYSRLCNDMDRLYSSLLQQDYR